MTRYSSSEAQRATGATYRQLDHWARTYGRNTTPGSGNRRVWRLPEIAKAAAFAALSEHFDANACGSAFAAIAACDITDVDGLTIGDGPVRTYIDLDQIRRTVEQNLRSQP